MKLKIIFLLYIFIFQSKSFTIHDFHGHYLKDCRIKFHDLDWKIIDDCDKPESEFDQSWPGADVKFSDFHIDYNLGDRVNIYLKVFNNLPYHNGPESYDDYCSIYIVFNINEYYIDNEKDFIYYCNNCDCTTSLGEKTFCHQYEDIRLYCNPTRGKEYNFFIRINGYNELDLMDTYLTTNNFYKINGNDYYLSEMQDNQEIKFSSDEILNCIFLSEHKVILDELSIKYSFEGYGEFKTIYGENLPSSGVIGSDIIFIRPKNIEGNETFHTKFTAQTIAKFGLHKGNRTSDPAEFNFYFCAPGYKMDKNKICYKCFESCYNCSEPGNSTIHNCENCNHLNLYYFYINETKNCNPSCKSIDKVRIEKNKYFCINKDECNYYISSDEESCIPNCSLEFEYLDNRTGIISQMCLNQCDDYISNDNTICLDSCKRINQLIDNITLSKKCTTESLCILNQKFINSIKTSCNQNCSSIFELNDKRYNDYRPNCLSYEQCDRFISSNGENCIYDCPNELEIFDERNGARAKKCIKKEMCDSWISANNTICLNDCKTISEISDLDSHTCTNICNKNLFFTPELMICDTKCQEPYKFFIKYENDTKICVKKCDKYPYIVLDEGNLECLIFNKFEIISIQMNPVINSKNEKFPIYYINKGIKNLTIKVAFNQNIRKRIELLNGNFEINRENNNSIIIKIEDINEKRIFNFRDNIDDSYHFGFEIDVVSSFDLLVVILIGVIVILSIILIIISICFCKKQKQSNDFKKNSFLQINNNNN